MYLPQRPRVACQLIVHPRNSLSFSIAESLPACHVSFADVLFCRHPALHGPVKASTCSTLCVSMASEAPALSAGAGLASCCTAKRQLAPIMRVLLAAGLPKAHCGPSGGAQGKHPAPQGCLRTPGRGCGPCRAGSVAPSRVSAPVLGNTIAWHVLSSFTMLPSCKMSTAIRCVVRGLASLRQ